MRLHHSNGDLDGVPLRMGRLSRRTSGPTDCSHAAVQVVDNNNGKYSQLYYKCLSPTRAMWEERTVVRTHPVRSQHTAYATYGAIVNIIVFVVIFKIILHITRKNRSSRRGRWSAHAGEGGGAERASLASSTSSGSAL